jgi:hypothetical protein
MNTIHYETFGKYDLILNFCPFIRHIKTGSLDCIKCRFFVSKNKKLKQIECSYSDNGLNAI